MKRHLYLTILLSISVLPLCFKVHAAWGELGLGLGSLTQNVSKVQTDNQGGTYIFDFNPVLLAQMPYQLPWQSFSIIPQFGIGLPQEGRDPNIKKMTYFLLADLGYSFEYATLRAGTGFSFTYITSDGGNEILRNGNTTESFPLPDGASTTRNLVANLGIQTRFLQKWQAQMEVMVFNPGSSFNRSISYFLGIQYLFDIWK